MGQSRENLRDKRVKKKSKKFENWFFESLKIEIYACVFSFENVTFAIHNVCEGFGPNVVRVRILIDEPPGKLPGFPPKEATRAELIHTPGPTQRTSCFPASWKHVPWNRRLNIPLFMISALLICLVLIVMEIKASLLDLVSVFRKCNIRFRAFWKATTAKILSKSDSRVAAVILVDRWTINV